MYLMTDSMCIHGKDIKMQSIIAFLSGAAITLLIVGIINANTLKDIVLTKRIVINNTVYQLIELEDESNGNT